MDTDTVKSGKRNLAGRHDQIKATLIQPSASLSQEPISMALNVNPVCSDIALPRFSFIIPAQKIWTHSRKA